MIDSVIIDRETPPGPVRKGSGEQARGAAALPRYLRDSTLLARYKKLRRLANHIVGSSYDITSTCNLRCEGCLFFEGDDYRDHADDKADAEWDRFFAAERARGVNFPFIAGAEPSLVPDRLRLAARHFARGVVFTNGSVRLDPALPFAIHVSLWGGLDNSAKFRGGNGVVRAFRNFADDPRARFVYTVNAQNLASAGEVAEICRSHGAKLTFSLFSPTTLYNWKLENGASNDGDYFRLSSPQHHLALDAPTLIAIRDELDRLIEQFPDTLIYTKAYNHWVTDPDGLYDIDPRTGWATDCETRLTSYHKHFRTDLTSTDAKCCSPNIDCRSCRAYAMASGTAVNRMRRFLDSEARFRQWLDIAEQWSRLFLLDADRAPA